MFVGPRIHVLMYVGQLGWGKNWKLPNEETGAVPQRTDNAMAKRKGTKRQTIVHKTLHRKQTIEKQELTKKRWKPGNNILYLCEILCEILWHQYEEQIWT